MAILKSRSPETVKHGFSLLKPFAVEPSPRPFVLYGHAKYQLAFKESEPDIVAVIEQGQRLLNEPDLNVEWPFQLLTNIFKESQQVSSIFWQAKVTYSYMYLS